MRTDGYDAARGTSGSRTFTLNLVAGGVEAPFEGLVAYMLPYDDDTLRRARAENLDGFVVFRWTNDIIAVPLGDALPAGDGWTKRRISVTALTPMRRLIEAGVGRSLASRGAVWDRGRGVLVVDRRAERDFVGRVSPELRDRVPFIHVYPRWDLSARIIERRSRETVFGVQVGTRTRNEIALAADGLRAHGISLVGRDMLTPRTDATDVAGSEANLRRAGRILSIDGDKATVAARESTERLSLSDLYLDGRRDNLRDVVQRIWPAGRRELDRVHERVANWMAPRERHSRIRSMADLLAKSSVDLGGGARFAAAGLLDITPGNDAGRYVRFTEPTYVFDVARRHTDLSSRRGVEKHGPFDSETFSPKERRAVVVVPRGFKGVTEVFLKSLLDGLPNARVYAAGFARKYRLTDLAMTFEVFETTVPESRGYREACLAALAAEPRPDLAFVVIEERHKGTGLDDPYLIAKSTFLSQGVPVQELELETIRGPQGSLPFVLDNIALASYAKMGGIPFVMAAQSPIANELVFGIGSAVLGAGDGVAGERVVGITSVFSADGNYLLSYKSKEATFADYPAALTTTLRSTVKDIERRNGWQAGDEVRLIFHSFNRMRDVDAKAVKALVDSLGEYRVEYAFVHINEDHDWFLFDRASSATGVGAFVPDRGYAVPLGRGQMLLTVTGPRELKNRPDATPRPLVLELHRESTFEDLDYIAQQVFRFTALSWRSFAPSGQPITVGYSERIASLLGRLRDVPNWNPDVLDTRLRRSLWFL